MKVGSIVEPVGDFSEEANYPDMYPVIPKKGQYYTVREIVDLGPTIVLYIRLEEIRLPIHFCGEKNCPVEGTETSFPMKKFREVQFPPNLEEEIKHCLEREFVEISPTRRIERKIKQF